MKIINCTCVALLFALCLSCGKKHSEIDYSGKTLQWLEYSYQAKKNQELEQWLQDMLIHPQGRGFALAGVTDLEEIISVEFKITVLDLLKEDELSETDFKYISFAAGVDASKEVRHLAVEILMERMNIILENGSIDTVLGVLNNTLEDESDPIILEKKMEIIDLLRKEKR